MYYVLDEHNQPKLASHIEWAEWLENDERRFLLQQRWIRPDGIEMFVSTIFLGIDMGIDPGLPRLWETAVFIGGKLTFERRHTSREAALQYHGLMMTELRAVVLVV
jgi:hypothetical protein